MLKTPVSSRSKLHHQNIMSCGRHHPKTHRYAPRPNVTTHRKGPLRLKQMFLHEMRKSNNPLEACRHARIQYSLYQDWLQTGFLSQADLAAAEAVFKIKHPRVDIIVKSTDQELEDAGIATTGVVAATGYDADSVLNEDGWIHTDDWQDDDL